MHIILCSTLYDTRNSVFPSRFLDAAPDLTSLAITSTAMTYVPARWLQSVGNGLVSVNLDANLITYIEPAFFQGHPWIQNLQVTVFFSNKFKLRFRRGLQYNLLTYITAELFNQSYGLINVDLRFNLIHTIDDKTFDNTPLLASLLVDECCDRLLPQTITA